MKAQVGFSQLLAKLLIPTFVAFAVMPMLAPAATAANAPPTISPILDRFIPENTSTGPLSFTVGDAETPLGLLSVNASSSNTALVPNGNIVLSGTGASRFINVIPIANQIGVTDITVTVTDGDGAQTSETFTVTVIPVEDPGIELESYANGLFGYVIWDTPANHFQLPKELVTQGGLTVVPQHVVRSFRESRARR